MKQVFGTVLVALGLLFTLSACLNAAKAPDISYLIGTYLPGILLLAGGVKLRQPNAAPQDAEAENSPLDTHPDYRSNAETGVLAGILLMFIGSGLAQHGETFVLGLAIYLGGWGLMIWGAGNYMISKGYSAWLGLFGLLLLPGLIILACFPDKTKNVGSSL